MRFTRNDFSFCQKLKSWKGNVYRSKCLSKITGEEKKKEIKKRYRCFLEHYIADYATLFDTEDYIIKSVNSIPKELRQELKRQYKELLLIFDHSDRVSWMQMDRLVSAFKNIDEVRADEMLYVNKKKNTIDHYTSGGVLLFSETI